MNKLIFIPSENNTPTHVHSNSYLLNYTYSERMRVSDKFNYFHCYIVGDAPILSGDACIVTDPDGCSFPEVCAEVTFETGRKIFYGKEGSRCLLCDVQKITATTNKALISHHISPLSGEEMQRLLIRKKQMASIANFFVE